MRKLFTLILAFMATTATLFASSGTCGENVNWDLTDGVLTISGSGPMDDYSKETDAPWYSERESITSVIIENGVTTVGRKAFMSYSTITSITLPESLIAIGDDAFRSASIESITIPANVASIGNLVFRKCTLLKTINVLPTTPPTLGTLTFSDIASDYVIYVPKAAFGAYKTADGWKDLNIQTEGGSSSSGTCGENVNWELIGGDLTISGTGDMADYASKKDVPWYDNHADIYTVTIGNGVTTIGKNAFYDCINMTSATIPSSVTTIKNYSFYRCTGLTNITCEATTPPTLKTNVFYEVDRSIPVYVPKGYISAYQAADDWNEFTNIQAIPDGTFGPCGENVNFDLTDGVLTISGSGPMKDYKSSSNAPWYSARASITSVVVEEGVTSIGKFAFRNCKMTTITLPNTLITIGGMAISRCTELTSVTIPSSITSIGESAFESCTGLTEITCEAANPPTLGENVFDGVATSILVYVPAGSKELYKEATGWKDMDIRVKGESTFTWTLKDGVLTISGSGPMDDYASETDMPWYSERTSIATILIEEGITHIGAEAFDGCTGAAFVNIASTVESIGDFAFYDCHGLGEIDCNAVNPPVLGVWVFNGVNPDIPVYVPADGLELYKVADGWNYFSNFFSPLTPEEQAAVDNVAFLINAIFDAPITLESEAAIVAARAAFDALTPTLQAQVYNYDLLKDAEATLAELKNNIPQITDGWVHYDNGEYFTSYSFGGSESWGILIPANTVSDKYLTKVGVFVTTAGEYKVTIYTGGATPLEAIKLGSEVVNMPNAEAFNEVALENPLTVDPTENIWVIFTNINGLAGPLAICEKPASNARWVSYDGTSWDDLADYGMHNASWLMRAFFEDGAAAEAVIAQIDAIGEVTLASEPAIVAAREAYDALTEIHKKLVTNYATLTTAEATLEILKKQAEGDAAAAQAVTDLINNIGVISYTPECKALIDAARAAYDALTDAQKALVPNYATLEVAEQIYAELKKEAEDNQAAANAVIAKINAIGEVTLASEAAINEARDAYNALNSIQQELVTNYGTLLAAENALEELKAQAAAVAEAKELLAKILPEAAQLKAVAEIYAPAVVEDINAIILGVQTTLDDPNVTADDVYTTYDNLKFNFDLACYNLLEAAKEQFKLTIIALYLPTDDPAWYDAVITPALNQVDTKVWDYSLTVAENIAIFQAESTTIYNTAKTTLEELRATWPEDVDNIQGDAVKTQKIYRNGHIFFLRDGKTYSIQGALLK